MSRSTIPPDRARGHEVHKRRLTDLERRVDDYSEDDYRPEAIFTISGPIILGELPDYIPRTVVHLTEVFAVLKTPSSSGLVTFDLLRSGTTLDTVSFDVDELALGPLRYDDALAPDVDRLTIDVTARGTGARDLSVFARFR